MGEAFTLVLFVLLMLVGHLGFFLIGAKKRNQFKRWVNSFHEDY